MPFEALSERCEIKLPDFPAEWLPLTYLYDPDLPLFPVVYFHALDPELPAGQRPSHRDRVFGYIQYVNLDAAGATAGLVLNKDLNQPGNTKYQPVVEGLVRDRLGLGDPIHPGDIPGSLKKELTGANQLLVELWHQIVAAAFGNLLPFGRIFDPVFGLVRFIASWNSEGGRKGELIQSHYFMSAFGVRIAVGGGVNADFYLLPTMEEFQDLTNPLNIFPEFSVLLAAAEDFVADHCSEVAITGQRFSKFNRSAALGGAQLNTASIRQLIASKPDPKREALFENYNAFNRGPHRSIISVMMLHDLRHCAWNPTTLTPEVCARMYSELSGTFQTPKVIQLYAQQCFGTKSVLPIDNWVGTFLHWPIGFHLDSKKRYPRLFETSDIWARIERLIWIASQARKVHSSVAAEILWCIRYGGPEREMRGANPLSCKICLPSIRSVCPAYALIKDREVVFNTAAPWGAFSISTSAGNATAPNQTFNRVRGPGVYDEYSTRDRPNGFKPYPQAHASGGTFTVKDFLAVY